MTEQESIVAALVNTVFNGRAKVQWDVMADPLEQAFIVRLGDKFFEFDGQSLESFGIDGIRLLLVAAAKRAGVWEE